MMNMSAVRRRSSHAGASLLVRLRPSSLSLLLLVVLRGRHSADSAPAPAGTHRFLAAIAAGGSGSGGGGTGTSGSHRQTSANDPCYNDDDSRHSLFTSRLITPPRPFRNGWLGSRVVSVLTSGAEGPGFKSQPRRCRITVLGKLFTPIVPLFTKQRNW